MSLEPPQLPPPVDPYAAAVADFINHNAGFFRLLTLVLGLAAIAILGCLVWMLGALVFSDAGLYTLAALAVIVTLPRLCLVLLVMVGIVAVAAVDQAAARTAELLAVWWPLALGLAAALILSLLTEWAFRR